MRVRCVPRVYVRVRPLRRGGALAGPLLAGSRGSSPPAREHGKPRARRAVLARPAATRAPSHAHAAAGLAGLGGRAGAAGRRRLGAEGAPLPGARPAASAGDCTQLATSVGAAGRRGGRLGAGLGPRTDLEGVAGLVLLWLGCFWFFRPAGRRGGERLLIGISRGLPLASLPVLQRRRLNRGAGSTPGVPGSGPWRGSGAEGRGGCV